MQKALFTLNNADFLHWITFFMPFNRLFCAEHCQFCKRFASGEVILFSNDLTEMYRTPNTVRCVVCPRPLHSKSKSSICSQVKIEYRYIKTPYSINFRRLLLIGWLNQCCNFNTVCVYVCVCLFVSMWKYFLIDPKITYDLVESLKCYFSIWFYVSFIFLFYWILHSRHVIITVLSKEYFSERWLLSYCHFSIKRLCTSVNW